MIRVFSLWRTVTPEKCFDRVAEILGELVKAAADEDLILAVENEHACNAGTGAETAAIIKAVGHPNLKAVWDPGNACVAGEKAFPDGYRALSIESIAHVHAKDCRLKSGLPRWVPLGTGCIDWKGQIEALLADGYRGSVSLETHWPGPGRDKFQGSVICGWNLRSLLA
jgi:sugar phosphate isomerase/epimerase